MNDETPSSRLIRIEARQEYQGQILERTATAVEAIAVISERMANHIEDAKRMHIRLDASDAEIQALKIQIAETHLFYQDMKRGLIALLGLMLTGGGYLIYYWIITVRP